MSFLKRRQEFDPSCPSGGTWYACGNGTYFVGCCREAACTDTGCSKGNLEPASFDPEYYGTFPDLGCETPGIWYTCNFTDPPFMGCCISNACESSSGCPQENLTGGILDNTAKASAYGITLSSTTSSTANVGSSTTSSSASSSATSSSTPVGAIAGGAAGGAVVLIAIVVGLVLYIRRLKRRAREAEAQTSRGDSAQDTKPDISPAQTGPAELSASLSVRAKGSSPPPRYSSLGQHHHHQAFELSSTPSSKARTPSELAGDEAYPPAELEGSSTAPSTPRSRRWTGESWGPQETKLKRPKGLGISHSRTSSRSSPRSLLFPENQGGRDEDEISGAEGTISWPSTPRSPAPDRPAAAEGPKGSPAHPPPIAEERQSDGET